MRAKTNYAERPADLDVFTGDVGQSIVVFRLNIEEVEVEEGTAFAADEYRLTVHSRANLEEQIREHIEDWRNRAVKDDYEKAAAEVRAKRNALLEESDKEMLLDRIIMRLDGGIDGLSQFVENSGIASYRRALRDITEQPGFPYDVVFPEKPNGGNMFAWVSDAETQNGGEPIA